MVGVPLKAPVVVLNVMPAGAAGEIENDVIAPPVEFTVNPVARVLTIRVSLVDDKVNAGAATTTAKVKVLLAVPEAFVAVTVYTVAAAILVGVPLNAPVVVLNVIPAGAAGEIE